MLKGNFFRGLGYLGEGFRLIRQPGYSVVLIEGLMRDKMEEDICIIDSDLCIIQIYSAGVSIHLI